MILLRMRTIEGGERKKRMIIRGDRIEREMILKIENLVGGVVGKIEVVVGDRFNMRTMKKSLRLRGDINRGELIEINYLFQFVFTL